MTSIAKSRTQLLILGGLAGLIYNSWIAGYWLNPTVARHGLASELEAIHQPYNWLFIGCDVICGSAITLLSVWLWRQKRLARQLFVLVCYASFGLFTIVDALLPMQCDPSVQQCPDVFHQPLLIAHGVCSIVASLGLFLAVASLWWTRRRQTLLQLLIVGYVLFGVFSIISLITPGQDSWAQHYSLLLDGICIMAVPVILSAKKSR